MNIDDFSSILPSGIATALSDAGVSDPVSQASICLLVIISLSVGAQQLLSGSGESESAGMDEWASLAAAEGAEEPSELREYNPAAISEYFKKRPLTLLRRGARSVGLLGSFGFGLYMDKKILGDDPDEKKKAEVDAKRAAELRKLLVTLGPTYVKLGQVLSSRQDLLPAPYVAELRTLQDAVPPFDNELAKRIITRELGPGMAEQLSLGSRPVASASLGQVYKGQLRTSPSSTPVDVAVKVQRPGALVAISLDIGIIRAFAEPWRKYKNLNTDLEGLIDEWGRRFIAELDYEAEASNGERFAAAMAARPDLAGVVTAAPVRREATTRRVLTTGWVKGQRLDTSEAGDIPQLCAVALSAYLAMLLDIGVLHADPHPGNLFRTEDGMLCILDWGLVTPVSPSLSTAILQFIAHLVSKDFEAIPGDLNAMGFIPEGKQQAMEDAGVASALGLLFSALARGGGADGFRDELGLPDKDRVKELQKELKGIKDPKVRRDRFLEEAGSDSKVAQLTRDLEGVQEKYGNIFQIPTYFGYILRSFSVLEGIGLAADPSYSIANECYPYVARRLLTDPSPDSRRALEQLLYGKEGAQAQLSVKRVRQMAEAFGSYSDVTAGPPAAAGVAKDGDQPTTGLPSGVKEALRLAFAPEGGPVQDIALRELARYAGALSVEAAAPLLALPLQLQSTLPGSNSAASPVLTAFSTTEADRETLRVADEIRSTILGQPSSGTEPQSDGTFTDTNSFPFPLPPGFTTVEVPLLGPVPVIAPPSPFPSAGLPAPPAIDRAVVQDLLELAPELAPGVQAASLRFGSELLTQAANRVASAAERSEAAEGKRSTK